MQADWTTAFDFIWTILLTVYYVPCFPCVLMFITNTSRAYYLLFMIQITSCYKNKYPTIHMHITINNIILYCIILYYIVLYYILLYYIIYYIILHYLLYYIIIYFWNIYIYRSETDNESLLQARTQSAWTWSGLSSRLSWRTLQSGEMGSRYAWNQPIDLHVQRSSYTDPFFGFRIWLEKKH